MSNRREALLASLVLSMAGAGAAHGVWRAIDRLPSYSAHEWRLLVRGNEQMRIEAALGERVYGWYRAVVDARRDEKRLFTFAGLTRAEITRYESDGDLIPPELIDAMLASYKLRRLLFPTLVYPIATDDAAPAGPALVLDLSGDARVPLPGRERATTIRAGRDYTLLRIER